MFSIIGADQQEYGPVAAETLRQWVVDGRANARTLVRPEGGTEWKALAEYPEFAAALAARGGSAPAGVPPTLGAGPATAMIPERELHFGRCLGASARLLKDNFMLLVGATILNGLAQAVAKIIPFGDMLVGGVLKGGLCLLFLKRIRGQSADLGDAFSGFSVGLVPLLITGLLTGLLTALGFLCCILPGVYLLVAWCFSLALVADKGLGFWDAMELSRRTANRVWFQLLALLIVAFLPTIVCTGFMGYTFYSALSGLIAAGTVDPARIVNALTATGAISLVTTLVSLINLPFAVGALMHAYEDLFGSGPAPTA